MSAPRKKLTRKRLNNALAQVYREHPAYFHEPPTKMSFFEHVHAGNLDDVQEFLEEEEFNINMRDPAGSTPLFYAMDGAGGLPMVKLLIENGADINAMNNIGEVPFHVVCYDLLSLTPSQVEILQFMIAQQNLILFPYNGRPLESIFLQAVDDIGSYQNWVSHAEEYDPESIRPTNRERLERERAIQPDLLEFYSQIERLSEYNVQYVRVIPQNQKELVYFHLDTRMTGAQLKEFMLKQVFRNHSLNLDFLFGSTVLDPSISLADQGVENESTIRYQPRLASGLLRRGGKRKTRRRT